MVTQYTRERKSGSQLQLTGPLFFDWPIMNGGCCMANAKGKMIEESKPY